MTSQPRDKTRDSTKHDTAKFGIDLYSPNYGLIIKLLYSRENPMIVHHQVEI